MSCYTGVVNQGVCVGEKDIDLTPENTTEPDENMPFPRLASAIQRGRRALRTSDRRTPPQEPPAPDTPPSVTMSGYDYNDPVLFAARTFFRQQRTP